MASFYDTVVLRGVNLQTSKIGCDTLKGIGDPAPRFESGARALAHGSWRTKAYLTPRSFTLGGWVQGANSSERDSLWWLIQYAAAIEDVPLTFVVKGRIVTYRVMRTSEFQVEHINPTTSRWQCVLTAHNPLGVFGGQTAAAVPTSETLKIVAPALATGFDPTDGLMREASNSGSSPTTFLGNAEVATYTVKLPSVQGLSFPATPPLAFPAAPTGAGSVSVYNAGTANAYPKVSFSAGSANLVDPTLTIKGSNGAIISQIRLADGTVPASSSYTSFDFNKDNLSFETGRARVLQGTWPYFAPGANTMTFSATSGASNAYVTATFSPAD